ncbi:hypothetical protein ONE63_011555 [Megalurothrips usitatus]|uniref:Uncharacterized protein n=1 Tax=Megalurothrips usitatus TaxID=439358 RepID=A0AAV7WZ05_9NEOP|nr:hypothetical protein ONE63_011555 [Megalurothrips usitatus]
MEELLTQGGGGGLPHLVEKCRELRFSKTALLLCCREDVNAITPFIGEQVQLWAHINRLNQCNSSNSSESNVSNIEAPSSPGPSSQQSGSAGRGRAASPKPSTSNKRHFNECDFVANKKLCSLSNSRFIDQMTSYSCCTFFALQ